MEKIKQILTGHHEDKDKDKHHASTSASTQQSHPPAASRSGYTSGDVSPGGTRRDDTGVARQALNPGDNKYDETRYGSSGVTAAAGPTGDFGVTRNTNVQGANYGLTGERGAAGAGATHTSAGHGRGDVGTDYSSGKSLRPEMPEQSASTVSIKSGIEGYNPHSRLADPLSSGSTVGRGIAPATGAGVTGSSLTDRSVGNTGREFPLSGGATTGAASGLAAGAVTTAESGHQHPPLTEIYKETVFKHEHGGHGHQYEGDPCETDHEPAPGPHFVPGPHATNTANMLDPKVGNTPLTALAGEAGLGSAAGSTGTGLGSSVGRTTGLDRDAGMSSTTGYAGAGHGTTMAEGTTGQHHYGRDAALAGAGAAAVGGLAAGSERSHRAGPTDEDPASRTTGPHRSNIVNVIDPRVRPQPEKMKDRETEGPHRSDTMNRVDPRVDSSARSSTTLTNEPRREGEHHHGRDAALVGGVGAAGAGLAAAGHHHDHPRDPITEGYQNILTGREDVRTGVHDPSQPGTSHIGTPQTSASQPASHYTGTSHTSRNVAAAGAVGAAGVGAYEYSKHDDGLGRQHLTEQPKQSHLEQPHEEKERKGSILGFLHRDKDKKEKKEKKERSKRRDSSSSSSSSSSDPDKESGKHHRKSKAAAGATVGAAAVGAGEHERNRLHKEPPLNHPAHQGPHVGVDGPIGRPDAISGLRGPGAVPVDEAQGKGIVIEPHTGLPMNVGKYGTGRGGIDQTETIEGFHHDPVKPGEVETDWEAIRKANTPY